MKRNSTILKELDFKEDGGCYRKYYSVNTRISVYGKTIYAERYFNDDDDGYGYGWGWYDYKPTSRKMLADIAKLKENLK